MCRSSYGSIRSDVFGKWSVRKNVFGKYLSRPNSGNYRKIKDEGGYFSESCRFLTCNFLKNTLLRLWFSGFSLEIYRTDIFRTHLTADASVHKSAFCQFSNTYKHQTLANLTTKRLHFCINSKYIYHVSDKTR